MANKRFGSHTGSFIKWAGGKGQLLEQFAPYLPRTLQGRGYIEPFVGSGAVFFYVVQNLRPSSCTLLDINPELINAFQQVRDNVADLIELLAAHKSQHNRDGVTLEARKAYFYGVRAITPDTMKPAQRAARFIYLNKTCFNGLHRLNSKGEFNVPIGSYAMPTIFDAQHLRDISCLLHGVRIEQCSFHDCEPFIGEGDFVYFDPPYEPLSRTSNFTGYSKEDFTPNNQGELRDLLKRISPRCDFMLSNSTAPLIGELYSGPPFHTFQVSANRTINAKASGRGKIAEYVITNYLPETVKEVAKDTTADPISGANAVPLALRVA